jgi:hypothetical protein
MHSVASEIVKGGEAAEISSSAYNTLGQHVSNKYEGEITSITWALS